MKLTKRALTELSKRNLQLHLAIGLSFSEQWIGISVAKNKDNGPLTTVKALSIIKRETGLTDEEILTEETETKGGKKNGLGKSTRTTSKITV